MILFYYISNIKFLSQLFITALKYIFTSDLENIHASLVGINYLRVRELQSAYQSV